MTELIKIEENEDGIKTVNARELHEFLESKQDFSTWVKKRIEKYQFIKGEDFTVFHKKMENLSEGGRPLKEYHISIDMAKELSMVENNEKGREIRKYFIECERRFQEAKKLVELMSERELLATALISANNIIEEKKKETVKLKAKIIQDQPKVEFYDTVVATDGAVSMSEAIKLIGVPGFGRTKLYAYLRKKGVFTQNSREPMQRYIDAGWFNITESTYTTEYSTHVSITPRVYQKGIDGIRRMMKKDGLLEKENKNV
jgi:anti-repressor protein